MRKYLYIGIGGFFGAVLRYLVKSVRIENYRGQFPVNTLVVNLIGCFLLAFLMTMTLKLLKISTDARLGIGTGFIGAFTTFSALCKEISMLVWQGYYLTAIVYTIVSVAAGLCFAYLGYRVAQKLIARGKVSDKTFPGLSADEEGEGV